MTRALSPPLPDRALAELALVSALVLAPMAVFQPISITLLAAAFLTWALLQGRRRLRPPPRILLFVCAVIGVALVFYAHRQIIGKLPGLSLLTVLMPLKLLESRNTRDARAALMLGLFLQIGLFALSQEAWLALCVLINSGALLAATARVQSPQLELRLAATLAGRLLLQGLPLMLILFLLFPRIDGPLWGMPLDTQSARSGLPETMSPGSINQLAMSGDIAFRVEFDGAAPPNNQRYWRGPVLTHFDGSIWRGMSATTLSTLPLVTAGQEYRYTSTLEPHHQRWLLALDYPGSRDDTHFTHDYTMVVRERLRARARYAMTAWPAAQIGLAEGQDVLAANLRLPPRSNPRTQAKGAEIARQHALPSQRLTAALAFMRQSGLQYTLYPPLLGEHTADEFLFDTRQGFCEHFASAFVILARAAGLSARVVTGYQGGEINPVDNTLVVRQSDAHAWAEVWLEGRGWQRVDPTAASFPLRIDSGLADALPADESLPLGLRRDIPWLQQMRFRWEALGNAWNQWVLGYNASRQLNLMRQIGLPDADWRMLAGLLTFATSTWLLWILWQYRPQGKRRDALDLVWQELLQRLARRGATRFGWEGPQDYVRRIAPKFPQDQKALLQLAEDYAHWRYSSHSASAEDVRMLAQRVRQLTL